MKNSRPALIAVALALAVACPAQAATAQAGAPPGKACMQPGTWYAVDDRGVHALSARTLLDDVSRRQVVLLGEQHDSVTDHVWQLQTLGALRLLHPSLAIGFESFPRRVQPVLDRWIAGKLTEKEFLAQTEWEKVWNFPPALYMPLFEFARLNRIPMIALNVEHTLTEAINAHGWDAVPREQKEGVSRPAAPSAAYEDTLFHVYAEHRKREDRGAQASRDDPGFRRFVESQTTWDRAMAEALASSARAGGDPAPLVVGIMGAGHVSDRHGVPHQLRDLGVTRVATLLPVAADGDCSELEPGIADAVYAAAVPPPQPAPPPRLGVQLGTKDGTVQVEAVTPGSLAERSGLKHGDRIVALAGSPVKGVSRVVEAVRAQPPGTWLPMQIRRGDATIDVVVRFPPR